MDPLDLLEKILKKKSQGQVALDLKVSKTTVSLVRRKKYPNPSKIYQKIQDEYGEKTELFGVEASKSAVEIFRELEDGV